jgi:hypothetical protein
MHQGQFIDAIQILPQHVSAIRCHHQVVVFTSEAVEWDATKLGRIPRQLVTLDKL